MPLGWWWEVRVRLLGGSKVTAVSWLEGPEGDVAEGAEVGRIGLSSGTSLRSVSFLTSGIPVCLSADLRPYGSFWGCQADRGWRLRTGSGAPSSVGLMHGRA